MALRTERGYLRTKDQISSHLGDEIVILDLKGGVYYGLEGCAVQVWESLTQPRTCAQIAESLSDDFDVPPEVCRRDVDSLLMELSKRGLVHAVDARVS